MPQKRQRCLKDTKGGSEEFRGGGSLAEHFESGDDEILSNIDAEAERLRAVRLPKLLSNVSN
eukprot:CAMPEP_0171613078 /NCGR_PEP_ID=MMETSP0990-20121206/11566_1 /TAXON_ID=483369 /ORGANISM="non described non described, Strain CCMP2098" /LENGTH=61 /DNA_ID=CAMNT_0012176881 /DNA_START=196 /DNA_END=381 /DNA_ORIENTATION=+